MENFFSGGLCCPCTTIDACSRKWEMQLTYDGKIYMHYHHLWCIDIKTEYDYKAAAIRRHSFCCLQWLTIGDPATSHEFIVFPQSRDPVDTLYNALTEHQAMIARLGAEIAQREGSFAPPGAAAAYGQYTPSAPMHYMPLDIGGAGGGPSQHQYKTQAGASMTQPVEGGGAYGQPAVQYVQAQVISDSPGGYGSGSGVQAGLVAASSPVEHGIEGLY